MADSREYRSKFVFSSLVFLGILFGILVSIYFLRNALGAAKLDMTQDKIFTISLPTKQILEDLKDEVLVRYYCSEEVPSALVNLKRDTIDMFRELESLSHGHFKWEVVAPEEEARKSAADKVREYYEAKARNQTPKEPSQKESFEDIFMGGRKGKKTDEQIAQERRQKAEILASRSKGGTTAEDHFRQLLTEEFKETYLADLQKQGIFPVPVEERQGATQKETVFFTAIEIKYLNKTPEVISVHHQIPTLEYELASKILKLTQKSKPKVVVFDGRKPEAPPMNPMNPMARPPSSDYGAIIQELGELFEIEETSLKENNSIADVEKRIQEELKKKDDDRSAEEKAQKISCLIVAQPNDLEARQIYEISKAVSEGIPTIFLVSNYSIDVSEGGLQNGIPITTLRSGLDDLFRSWGVSLGKDLLASRDCGAITVTQRVPGIPFPVRQRYAMPVNAMAQGEAINQRHPLTNRIQDLVFPAAVGFNLNEEDMKKAGVTVTELANSGHESYSVQVGMFEQDMFNRVQTPSVLKNKELMSKREHKEGFISPKPLAILLEGKFPFKYQDQPIPEWKKEDKTADKSKKHPPVPGMENMDFPDLEGAKGPRGPSEGDELLAQATAPTAPAPAAPAAGQASPPAEGAKAPPAAPAAGQAAPPAAQPPAKAAVPTPPASPEAKVPTPPVSPGGAKTPATPPAAAPPPAAAASAPAGEKKDEKKDEKKEEPRKEPEKAHLELKDGRVALLSSVDMMKNQFLQQGEEYQANGIFFYNTIETFGLNERLLKIRKKELTVRRFKASANENAAVLINMINIGLVPLLVAIFGISRFLFRRAESNAYERQFIETKLPGQGQAS